MEEKFEKSLWKLIDDSFLLMEIGYFNQDKLYSFLSNLTFLVRSKLYHDTEEKSEKQPEYSKFINKTLTASQIDSLFGIPIQPPHPPTKRELKSLCLDLTLQIQNLDAQLRDLVMLLDYKESLLRESIAQEIKLNVAVIPSIKDEHRDAIRKLLAEHQEEINRLIKKYEDMLEDERKYNLGVIATSERWNKSRIAHYENQIQELIGVIRQKNDELDDLENKLFFEELNNQENQNKDYEEFNDKIKELETQKEKNEGYRSFGGSRERIEMVGNITKLKEKLYKVYDRLQNVRWYWLVERYNLAEEKMHSKKDRVILLDTLRERKLLKARIETLIKQRDSFQRKYQEQKTKLDETEQKWDKDKEELDQRPTREEEENARDDYDKLLSEKLTLEEQLKKSKASKKKGQKTKKHLENKIKQLEEDKQKLIDIIRTKNNDLDDLEVKQSLETSQTEKDYQEHLDLSHQDIENYRQQIKELEDSQESKDNIITYQKTEIEKWINKYWRERKAFIRHDRQLAEDQARIVELEQDLDNDNEVLGNKNQTIADLNDFKDENKILVKTLKRTKRSNGRLVNNLHKLAESKEEVKNELWNTQEQLRSAEEELNETKERLSRLETDYSAENENHTLQGEVNRLEEVIATTQEHLEVEDLTKIKTTHQMPEGKSLTDLIEFYNNPPQTAPKVIVEEKLTPVEVPKEVEVIKEVKSNTPFGEDLEKIIEIDLNAMEKELGIELNPQIREEITKAVNYQELSTIRNQEIKNYLEKRSQNINAPTQLVSQPTGTDLKWRWILIALLAVKGMIIVGLVTKLVKKKNRKRK